MSNYSLHAIPAYWVLTLLPHAYGVQQLKSANNGKWDNVNSRGTETVATYRKSVPAEVYARFERAEAAHKNGFENAPFFIGAVIAGNMAGLSAETMNVGVGVYLALRVLYTALYINTTQPNFSFARSLTWAVSTAWLIRLFWKAGNKWNA